MKRHHAQRGDRAQLIESLRSRAQLSRERQKRRLGRVDHDVGLAELNLYQAAGSACAFHWNEVEVRQGAAVFADESELVERPAAADQEPHDGLSVGTGRGGRRQGSPEGALEEDDAEQAGYEQKGRGFIC